jgi:Glutamyl-tRNA amidotransferase complex subunit Gta3
MLVRSPHNTQAVGFFRAISASRAVHTGIVTSKLSSPVPPDLSKASAMNIDKFIGSPGWKLDDLLPPHRGVGQPCDSVITPDTLRHLLQLSSLPPPTSSGEESKLLSALHDQLHFVRHVQSVATENVEPLVRVGNEHGPEAGALSDVLTFEECVAAGQGKEVAEQWDVCQLDGGSHHDRSQGYIVVQDQIEDDDDDEDDDVFNT